MTAAKRVPARRPAPRVPPSAAATTAAQAQLAPDGGAMPKKTARKPGKPSPAATPPASATARTRRAKPAVAAQAAPAPATKPATAPAALRSKPARTPAAAPTAAQRPAPKATATTVTAVAAPASAGPTTATRPAGPQLLVLGVDPGKHGALAALDHQGRILALHPTPLIKGQRDTYDLAAIRELLLSYQAQGRLHVTVERMDAMPAKLGGSIANYHRGVSTGWAWMLEGLKIPYELVPAREWQRAMHAGTQAGDTKQRSILAAQRLFPSQNLKRSPLAKGPDDGLADALLIAEFGRRKQLGLATTPAAAPDAAKTPAQAPPQGLATLARLLGLPPNSPEHTLQQALHKLPKPRLAQILNTLRET